MQLRNIYFISESKVFWLLLFFSCCSFYYPPAAFRNEKSNNFSHSVTYAKRDKRG